MGKYNRRPGFYTFLFLLFLLLLAILVFFLYYVINPQQPEITANPTTTQQLQIQLQEQEQRELSEYTPLGILTRNQPPASEAAFADLKIAIVDSDESSPNPVTGQQPVVITDAIIEGLAPGYQEHVQNMTNTAGSTFPLIGRNINRDNWNYYTIQKLPIYNSNNKNCLNEDGCQLLSDGDIVKIEGTDADATFKVTYDNDL